MNILTVLFAIGFVSMSALAAKFLFDLRQSERNFRMIEKANRQTLVMLEGAKSQIGALIRERDFARSEYHRMLGVHTVLEEGDRDRAKPAAKRTDPPLLVGGFAVTEIFSPDTQIME